MFFDQCAFVFEVFLLYFISSGFVHSRKNKFVVPRPENGRLFIKNEVETALLQQVILRKLTATLRNKFIFKIEKGEIGENWKNG